MTIAALAIGAGKGFLYLRGEYLYLLRHLQDVLARRRAAGAGDARRLSAAAAILPHWPTS